VKDLTAHSIGKHILPMALPIAAGMLFQTLYFLIDAMWLTHQPGFRLVELWYVSIASMTVQAVVSRWLMRAELRRRMPDTMAAAELQAAE
jgi:Na+-driven multidrug efflux pump